MVRNWKVYALALLAVPAMAHGQANTISSSTTWQPQVVVVQFEAGVRIPAGAAKTGLQVFDSRAAFYQVHEITRSFRFLDYVQPTPKTARNLEALRRTYYVRYSADVEPRRVAKVLGATSGVVYAEPVAIGRLSDSRRQAFHGARRLVIQRPDASESNAPAAGLGYGQGGGWQSAGCDSDCGWGVQIGNMRIL